MQLVAGSLAEGICKISSRIVGTSRTRVITGRNGETLKLPDKPIPGIAQKVATSATNQLSDISKWFQWALGICSNPSNTYCDPALSDDRPVIATPGPKSWRHSQSIIDKNWKAMYPYPNSDTTIATADIVFLSNVHIQSYTYKTFPLLRSLVRDETVVLLTESHLMCPADIPYKIWDHDPQLHSGFSEITREHAMMLEIVNRDYQLGIPFKSCKTYHDMSFEAAAYINRLKENKSTITPKQREAIFHIEGIRQQWNNQIADLADADPRRNELLKKEIMLARRAKKKVIVVAGPAHIAPFVNLFRTTKCIFLDLNHPNSQIYEPKKPKRAPGAK